MEILFLQIIKALNLYREKTRTENFFWVWNNNVIFFLVLLFWIKKTECFFILPRTLLKHYLAQDLMYIVYTHVVVRFTLIKGFPLGQGLVVEVAMLQLHYGQQINSVVVLPQRKNSKNGQVRLDQIFPSFSLREQPIALAEERLVPNTRYPPFSKSDLRKKRKILHLIYCYILLCGFSMSAANW